jgi:hypothetical protein
MEITKFMEKEDGSAEILMNFTDDEVEFLLNYAVIDILKKQLEEKK